MYFPIDYIIDFSCYVNTYILFPVLQSCLFIVGLPNLMRYIDYKRSLVT